MEEGISAHFKTEKGDIKIQLTFDKTPGTVGNFVGLVEGAIENKVSSKGTPYYDGLKFHRVIADFMIRGCPQGTGMEVPDINLMTSFIRNSNTIVPVLCQWLMQAQGPMEVNFLLLTLLLHGWMVNILFLDI